jgi:ABC-type molybdate transport system substrate-binding protein
VFAASSLTTAFTAAGKSFEEAHDGVRVRFSFAGSQALVAQLKQGAPADVLATADTTSMTDSGLSGARVFARNQLAIITAPGNPKHVTTLADLAGSWFLTHWEYSLASDASITTDWVSTRPLSGMLVIDASGAFSVSPRLPGGFGEDAGDLAVLSP